ncbi:hypothetical protein P3W45_000981 [Vairimorpha bombi]|jgi:SUMO ligase MMS21 Smc5/6 complex component
MDEYISKKKDLLDEIENSTVKKGTLKELISTHKEILSRKESILCAKTFRSYINKLKNVEESVDECEVKKIVSDTICPFSLKKIVNPFRNTCGHIYEKVGLEGFLKKDYKGQQVRCPVVGCNTIVANVPK